VEKILNILQVTFAVTNVQKNTLCMPNRVKYCITFVNENLGLKLTTFSKK